METTAPNCPVNGEKVNEHVVRLIAAQVIVIGIIASLFNWPLLTLFLAIDFGLRAFSLARFSVLRLSATEIAGSLKLASKTVDAAPKKFAALLGFVVVSGLFASQLFNEQLLTFSITGILVVFAVLESVFAICVGCIIYGFLSRTPLIR